MKYKDLYVNSNDLGLEEIHFVIFLQLEFLLLLFIKLQKFSQSNYSSVKEGMLAGEQITKFATNAIHKDLATVPNMTARPCSVSFGRASQQVKENI